MRNRRERVIRETYINKQARKRERENRQEGKKRKRETFELAILDRRIHLLWLVVGRLHAVFNTQREVQFVSEEYCRIRKGAGAAVVVMCVPIGLRFQCFTLLFLFVVRCAEEKSQRNFDYSRRRGWFTGFALNEVSWDQSGLCC